MAIKDVSMVFKFTKRPMTKQSCWLIVMRIRLNQLFTCVDKGGAAHPQVSLNIKQVKSNRCGCESAKTKQDDVGLWCHCYLMGEVNTRG